MSIILDTIIKNHYFRGLEKWPKTGDKPKNLNSWKRYHIKNAYVAFILDKGQEWLFLVYNKYKKQWL